ncbi:MAG: aspartate aminotransferase family protein [Alphaproteobacteria bacterium]|nr:aspartate aminotransferase family protein [Alphaproteobacteria bacterium]|tara:strand:- start:4767 stop:6077 length:1311 start_codon:yes stop_codon:yes gene_type:complete
MALQPNVDLDAALKEARDKYGAANPNSREYYESARNSLTGGLGRSSLYFQPFPLAFSHGEGAYIWDVDDHRYADFMGDYTAGIYGHNHPITRRVILETFDNGIALNGPHKHEAPFAEALCKRFPAFEQIRFANSGTEANIWALSLARVVSGKSHVMAFEGCYHGGVFNFEHGLAPVNYPIPWVMAPYNDLDGTSALIDTHEHELAAVIIEPMVGAQGCIPAETDFLKGLREITEEKGIILIFDEVMTSRLGPNGYQGEVGITPDLTSVSKYLGGGLTFGAFGGRADLMTRYDQAGEDPLPQAGTFNNNVLTMTAGLAALEEIYTESAARDLNDRGDDFRHRLNELAKTHGVPVQFTGYGSMLNIHFTADPILSPQDMHKTDLRKRDLFHFDMMDQAQYLARSGMIVLSLPMTDSEIDSFVAAVDEFFASRKSLLAD